MVRATLTVALEACGSAELPWCVRLNRQLAHPWVRSTMAIVSRLGDGWIWGLLLLAAWGWAAHALAWALLISGVCSTATYVAIKHACNRSRPCERSSQFDVPVLPLDRWSFPSGHTMHAVAFTVVFAATVPTALLALAPFTLLVMLSRVVLGLHYPSDVFAGGCGGLLSGYFALQLVA